MTDEQNPEDKAKADEEETYSSLIISDDQLETRMSALGESLKVSRASLGLDGTSASSESEILLNERSLYENILTRNPDQTKYQVIDEIAGGGMGSIYRVYDQDIRRYTVLKAIRPQHKSDLDTVKRFIFEARITGELEHPNIVSMHDFGFLPAYGLFFTMTHVHGESLYEIIDKIDDEEPEYLEKYDLYTLIGIFRKVCDAISYAHSRGVIHRDIKPENIMVGKFGEVILMDWGLAKRLSDSEDAPPKSESGDSASQFADTPAATASGTIKGTPVYLAPEQAAGDSSKLDEVTDIFLLGATLYHMFTHQAPFVGRHVRDAVERAQRTEYRAPEEFSSENKHLSKDLCRIIKKAMAAAKNDRYASVAHLIADLDDLLRGKMEYETVVFKKGEKLLEEGKPGTKCYMLLSGRIEVFKGSGDEKVHLGTLEKGEIVGEMALITNARRTATAVALTETKAVVLSKDVFSHNLKKLPIWMERAVTALANRLDDSNTKLTDSIVLSRDEIHASRHPFRL